MDINRKRLSFVCLFLIAICSLLLPLTNHAASRGISVISDLSHQSGKLGSYRALLIGINNYNDPKIPDLETAVNDATAMANLLRKRYGFKVKLLLDHKATKTAIYRALRSLASSTKPDDSVLIYYAGHGDLDRLTDDGWWIPADAKGGDPVTYLDNFQVQKYIRSMRARHVLLVSDSCYSGSLFGQVRAMPPIIDNKYYLNLYNEKSRWGMTSGNKTPVSDRGTGNHSVFAYQLLKELKKNEKPYISTQEIYTRIAPIVSNNSEQTPLCRPIRNTGDQGGEFIFVASSGAIVESPSSEPSNAYLSVESNVSGAKVSVDGKYVGTTRLSDVKIAYGEHSIRVEKDGYEPYARRIRFKKGRSRDLYVILDPKTPLKGSLYVNTQPEDARIRILNIGPTFHQGIELNSGQYHVEVSADGYATQKMWVSLTGGQDKTLDIHLKRSGQYQPVTTSQGQKVTNRLGMKFVYIAPGTFMMGSPSNESGRDNDEKQHRVRLTKGFYMQTTEVTVGQWRAFVRDTGYKSEAETGGGAYIWTGSKWEKKKGSYWDNPGFSQTENHPVTCVSWNDANAFIKWLSRKEGKVFRLPTEAEWEYAARAQSTAAFANGDISELKCGYDSNLDAIGWYCGNSNKRTHPVARKQANTWGLYDMHGNVWEWCQDWFGDYPSGSVTDPTGPSGGSSRVFRGGCWFYFARSCRSANRNRLGPGDGVYDLGFRLLRNP